jgi:HlyD family secretion protein
LEVTIDDEAKTRVRHVYTVSAPIAGKVLRISPPRHVGDQVTVDEAVAVMQPTVPSFHDARTHEELKAALAATEAAMTLAEAEVRRIEAALKFSRTELRRAEALARTEAISVKVLDKARFDVEINEAALASAKAQLEVRRNERGVGNGEYCLESHGHCPELRNACCGHSHIGNNKSIHCARSRTLDPPPPSPQSYPSRSAVAAIRFHSSVREDRDVT